MTTKNQFDLPLETWEEVIALTKRVISSLDEDNWLVNNLAIKAVLRHVSMYLESSIDGRLSEDEGPLPYSTVGEFEEITKASIEIIVRRIDHDLYT